MSRRVVSLFPSLLLLAAADGRAQTQAALLAGASTDVPPSANRQHLSLVDGEPVHVISGITGVEFHVPGVVSSAPGGLSLTPHPILKKANGVEYWFVSGELSGYTTNEWGNHVVIGPIDPQGHSHRDEIFGPAAHPRAGLPGAFFALMVPRTGGNRALLQTSAAGDAGQWWPAAPLTYNMVDPHILLRRGYSIFAFGHGGTVAHGLLPDGRRVVDTNPDSGSGIFWRYPGASDEDLTGIMPYSRYAFVDDVTRAETTLPVDFTMIVHGPWSLLYPDPEVVPIGEPWIWPGMMQGWGTEIIGDSAIFAKNLVRALWPDRSVTWTALLGWSGSGVGAIQINSGTRGEFFQVPQSAGPQIGGGNYNDWHEPSSGRRYDAFIVYAAVNRFQAFLEAGEQMAAVDPNHPATAPFVWLVPEYDVTLSQARAYDYANKIWRALDALGCGDELDGLIRIYSLPKATHMARGQIYASHDSTDETGGLWYDYVDRVPNPGALNTAGRGYRVSDALTQAEKYDPSFDGWAGHFQETAKLPRDTALWLQTLANLRRQAQDGTPLPPSRVDARLFDDIDAVSVGDALPGYPLVEWPDPETFEEFLDFVNSTGHTVQEDSGLWALPLEEAEVEALRVFAYENPLARTTRPLLLPDVAAPTTGPGFYDGDGLVAHSLGTGELRARYGQVGYAGAFAAATFALVADGLWDLPLGLLEIAGAVVYRGDGEHAPLPQHTGARSAADRRIHAADPSRSRLAAPSSRDRLRRSGR
jgi:hypothetical protein